MCTPQVSNVDLVVCAPMVGDSVSSVSDLTDMHSTSQNYIDDDVNYPYPCLEDCHHFLDGCKLQLNPCAFYNECFLHPSGPNAQFIYKGVLHGFDIIDDVIPESSICQNFSSILDDEFKVQIYKTVSDELDHDKVSLAFDLPHCAHSLGAVRKALGKLRPVTDCRRPLGPSINNYMESTCSTFSYTHIDQVTDALNRNSFMAVLDIKAAYCSVYLNHNKCQGFV